MISRNELLHLFEYDRMNGILIWKNPHKKKSSLKGKKWGTFSQKENRCVSSINKIRYKLHQLIWFIEKNEWVNLIDHIDGDGSNNRITNLRVATTRENSQNLKRHRNGFLVGATFHKWSGRWRSLIRENGYQTHLGYFNTEQEAHNRYVQELKARGL